MKVLVINSGSSSIKFQLIEMPKEKVGCSGVVERIGSNEAILSYSKGEINIRETIAIHSHKEGLKKIADFLLDPKKGVVTNPN